MEKRVISLIIILILFVFVKYLVPGLPAKEIPDFDVYNGELRFEGNSAYEKLDYITDNFKDRRIGTESNLKCAQWLKNEFEKLGLQVIEEDFIQYGFKFNSSGMPMVGEFVWKSAGRNLEEYQGKNIVAISPGREEDIILIGAHRDTINTLEGAEDDGSGTAVLIELAKILSEEDHRYTYYFVSFDGEEYGLYGSNYLAEKYKDKPIKLAVSLDMLGWNEAEGVSFYPFITTYNASELWSYALARKVLENEGIPFINTKYVSQSANRNLRLYISGIVPTDTNGFIKEGVPGLGVFASRDSEGGRSDKFDRIHTPQDTMEYISGETLGMTGRFMESYIRSIEKMGLENMPKDSFYLVKGDGIIPGGWMIGFIVFVFILVLLAVKLYYDSLDIRMPLVEIIKREVPWIISIVIAAFITHISWKLMRIEFVRNLPFFVLMILGFTLIVVLISLIVRYRNKYCLTNVQGVYVNKLMIFILILVWAVIASIVMNPFYVINFTAIPLVIMLVLSYTPWHKRVLSYFVFIPLLLIYHYLKLIPFNFDIPFFQFHKSISLPYFVLSVPFFIWAVYFISNPLTVKRK